MLYQGQGFDWDSMRSEFVGIIHSTVACNGSGDRHSADRACRVGAGVTTNISAALHLCPGMI